jgi:hypothetical protein
MVNLIRNKNTTAIKLQETVSKNTTPVKEVVDLSDDEGGAKAVTDVVWVPSEGGLDGVPKRVVDVPEREVDAGICETSVGADSDGGDAEETGLKEVSWGNAGGVMGVSLEREISRERRG